MHKVRTVCAMEFIRRFLQHVLPKGFQKVRYYGFLHPSNRHKLKYIQYLLDVLAFLCRIGHKARSPPVNPVGPSS
ncbi:transposase [Acidobacteriota bacterium]